MRSAPRVHHSVVQAWIQDAVLKLKASTRSQLEMVKDSGGRGALLPEHAPWSSGKTPPDDDDVLLKNPGPARTSVLLSLSRAGTPPLAPAEVGTPFSVV